MHVKKVGATIKALLQTGKPMLSKTPWLSRSFDFSFQPGYFPFIYVRLLGTPARMADLVKEYPKNSLALKPGGKWSVKEHIGHLVDLEELHEGRLEDYKNKTPVLRAADMSNKKTNEANHNSCSADELIAAFNKSRIRFLKELESLTEAELIQTAVHPRLNVKMRIIDMAYFVAEHDDHHIVCMWETLKKTEK